MKKQNLQARVDKLFALPRMQELPPFGKMFDAAIEMDWLTTGAANKGIPFEVFYKEYEKTKESKAAFTAERSLQWRQNRNGG